ncbi:hypothetical protein B0H65DRAFT_554110 [Neurospora tetraspora]|uniref:DUF8021 domain-containing protein n=1 Tax=Neurospora tetraspora TaxID=94610 RepID=A0AAE0JP09_9PEZI|nr:hypothetical protein B0H65DRAFT_554110 [Neurospora tetraspora]
MRSSILLTIFSSLITSASCHCKYSFLVDAASSYTFALSAGNPSFFTTAYVSPNTTYYTESDQPLDIRTGILSKPGIKITRRLSIHDTVDCSTFTQVISTDPVHPYVIGTRIVFGNVHHNNNNNNDTKATLIETLATKPGDWLFNATGYAHWDAQESWDPIPPTESSTDFDSERLKRDSRAVIKAAGDAYFDRFADVNVSVPFGTPCARLEGGGAYTDTHLSYKQTCDLGLPSNVRVRNRRYVVDETMGAVAIFVGFPGLDRSAPEVAVPDSHLFRVERGKIRYIHTLSTCVTPGCGLNGTLSGKTDFAKR